MWDLIPDLIDAVGTEVLLDQVHDYNDVELDTDDEFYDLDSYT